MSATGPGTPASLPRGVPAARQTLALLQALARQPGPVPAAALARELGLPRSTTYHLLAELLHAGFVVHLPEERRYGLGVSAFEIGSAYSRQEPLARLARPVLARLVDAVGNSAHLAVLHGREVLYVVEQRAPGARPWSPTSASACRRSSPPAVAHCSPTCRRRTSAPCSPTPAPSSTGTGWARAGCRSCAGCSARCAVPGTPPRTAR